MGVDYINNMTVAAAFDDKVYIQGLDANGDPVEKEVIIPEGWKAQIQKDGSVTPPAELSENEQKIFDAWVAVMTEGKTDDTVDKIEDKAESEEQDQIDGKDLDEQKKDEDEKKVISPDGSDECRDEEDEEEDEGY